MERIRLFFFLAALATLLSVGTAAPSHPDLDFIRVSCRSTRYPALCESSLSGYASTVHRSPRQLAHAALAVTLARARSASAFVGRLGGGGGGERAARRSREAGAVQDCIENVGDSVDRLRRSAAEMGRMGRAGSSGFAWHLSNVQTWVSAALTDETTCLDGFAGRNIDPRLRAAVRRQIVGLAQVTSNALALVNRIPLPRH
uniref:Pectinesterase inhibitor domain-containing protein n=1 Tax=Anthurium amnicola TaxID=1678845 RepID=A0A1D1YSC6_9ARAE